MVQKKKKSARSTNSAPLHFSQHDSTRAGGRPSSAGTESIEKRVHCLILCQHHIHCWIGLVKRRTTHSLQQSRARRWREAMPCRTPVTCCTKQPKLTAKGTKSVPSSPLPYREKSKCLSNALWARLAERGWSLGEVGVWCSRNKSNLRWSELHTVSDNHAAQSAARAPPIKQTVLGCAEGRGRGAAVRVPTARRHHAGTVRRAPAAAAGGFLLQLRAGTGWGKCKNCSTII